MYVYLPLLVSIIGAFVYVLSNNVKGQELGRLAYAVGLLAFLIKCADGMVNLPG